MSIIFPYYLAVARWLIAACSVLLIFLWIKVLRSYRIPLPVLATLSNNNGINIFITQKENIIGRTKSADIMLPLHDVSKKHAMLYFEYGHWVIAPIQGRVAVNLQNVTRPARIEYGDRLTICGQTMVFDFHYAEELSSKRPKSSVSMLLVLTFIQFLTASEVCLRFFDGLSPAVPACFGVLMLGQWIYYLFGMTNADFKFIAEIPILYLANFGLAICCTTAPKLVLKQSICFAAGFIAFLIFTFILKYRDTMIKIQHIVMLFSVLLLYYTAFFGKVINSSRNWLAVGGVSFQPSELCKVAFVFCGGTTLYYLMKKPSRSIQFYCYGILCMGALAIMLDFGAVAIFFVGMLFILALRLTSPVVIGGTAGAAALGGALVMHIYPYIAKRFGVWLHAWSYANSSGYQQTRTMIATASGGLLGVGCGNGYLNGIPAAETDLVFGIVAEEWGGIVALTAVLCIAALGLYAYHLSRRSNCMFYAILCSSCAVMMIFQTALNVFGSVDLLPLTGVTFVFLSRGGTSVIAAMFMLSFIKACELYGRQGEIS